MTIVAVGLHTLHTGALNFHIVYTLVALIVIAFFLLDLFDLFKIRLDVEQLARNHHDLARAAPLRLRTVLHRGDFGRLFFCDPVALHVLLFQVKFFFEKVFGITI